MTALYSFCRYVLLRFYRDKGLEMASALSFSTLLAAVPMAAIALGILGSVPALSELRLQLQANLLELLTPTVAEQVSGYLDRFLANAQSLTLPGVVGLFITALLLLSTIHDVMKRIRRSGARRHLALSFLAYALIIALGPVLVGLSLFATALLSDQLAAIFPWIAKAREAAGAQVIAFGFSTLGLFLLYRLAPGRGASSRDALIGAAAGALLIEMSKLLFAIYVDAFTSYEAIYGALSILPVLLLWLYVVWILVIVGAEIAASLPEWRARAD